MYEKLKLSCFLRLVFYGKFRPKLSVKLRNKADYQLVGEMFQKMRQNAKTNDNDIKN